MSGHQMDGRCCELLYEHTNRLRECGRPPVGYRLEAREGMPSTPYPVCRKHHRPPYWLTAQSELRVLEEERLGAMMLIAAAVVTMNRYLTEADDDG